MKVVWLNIVTLTLLFLLTSTMILYMNLNIN